MDYLIQAWKGGDTQDTDRFTQFDAGSKLLPAVMSEGAYLGWIDLFQGELNLLNDETERPGGPQLTLDEIWYETHWTDPDGDKSIERFQYDEPLRRAWVKARETFGTVYKCTSWVTREVEQP